VNRDSRGDLECGATCERFVFCAVYGDKYKWRSEVFKGKQTGSDEVEILMPTQITQEASIWTPLFLLM